MWKHMRVTCPECNRCSYNRSCQVVDHIPGGKGNRPIWILSCPYCHAVFQHISQPNLWRQLRYKGVPKEEVEALQRSLLTPLFDVLVRPHTEEERKGAFTGLKTEIEHKVQFLGKDGVFVGEVLYMKGSSPEQPKDANDGC